MSLRFAQSVQTCVLLGWEDSWPVFSPSWQHRPLLRLTVSLLPDDMKIVETEAGDYVVFRSSFRSNNLPWQGNLDVCVLQGKRFDVVFKCPYLHNECLLYFECCAQTQDLILYLRFLNLIIDILSTTDMFLAFKHVFCLCFPYMFLLLRVFCYTVLLIKAKHLLFWV